MTNSKDLLLLVAGVSIYFGQLIDWYSYHIKRDFLDSKSTEIMSVANWIQYAGRIANMAGVFLVSLTFEMGVRVGSIEIMFLAALIVVAISAGMSIKSSSYVSPAYFLQRLLCLRFFGGAGFVFYWGKLSRFGFNKMMVASLIVNVFLIVALVAPIFAASVAPQFRMSFAYLGQFLNFASSIIVFAYVDRILYKTEGKNSGDNISSILWGKLIAIFVTPSILAIYLL